MKLKLLTIASALFLVSAGSQAQPGKCSTMKMDSLMRALNTEIGTLEDFENWMAENMVDDSYFAGKTDAVIFNIPVIVHVIHNGENIGSGANISDAQIQSQIASLNKDFTKTNSDWTNTPAVWTSKVADCQINFFLTPVNKDGVAMATPGIDRANRNDYGFSAGPYSDTYINANIKPFTIWNPYYFLNIWTLNLAAPLLGFATFPPNSTLNGLMAPYGDYQTDGVVIKYNAFGTTGNLMPGNTLGRTTTHEVGHWLGLRHIWGDATPPNGAGCGTDYCNDTPTQYQENYGSPTFPSVSNCNGNAPNGDMFMNYMDYSDDISVVMFTNNQKSRMHTALTKSPLRWGLIASVPQNRKIDNFLSVYPNPTSGTLNINIQLFENPVMTVNVFNMMGQNVLRKDFESNGTHYVLDMSSLNSGVYFVQISNGKETSIKKVSVAK